MFLFFFHYVFTLCSFIVFFYCFCMLSTRDNRSFKKRRGRINLKINLKMHHTQVSFRLKNTKSIKYAVELNEFSWCYYIMFYRRQCYLSMIEQQNISPCFFFDPRQSFDPRYPCQNFMGPRHRHQNFNRRHLRHPCQSFMDIQYPRHSRKNLTHATHAPTLLRHPRHPQTHSTHALQQTLIKEVSLTFIFSS